MSIVDWIYIIGIALTIVLFLGFAYFLVQILRIQKQIHRLPSRRIKNKKKRNIIARKRANFMHMRKRSLGYCLSLFLGTGLFCGAIIYFSYYQAMNLTTGDSDSVVKGYYLLRDFEQQVTVAKEKGDDEEKIQKDIRYLATAMASYGTKTASTSNSQEGQLILNRYYNAIKQMGMNASTQTKNFYGNSVISDSFLEDIKKVQSYEKATFVYYKVDESAFSKEK
ncbi:hypothetical protein A5819_003563 [Enterococcus sp. 7E2_DIV0204]|uniref:hypothetical protein n=1 Tax=unclassified Enterococcus TaxID=2608891 RepID=UPI000A35B609|nr:MULTISPECIES: hypothetical protein [unclassified Enterococcus]OTN84013.1 hypothetical protein A5819_003563 [Enterococcus sp. 7E2_DIV0204]OTP47209.1 hypothetical protein A5884_003584 [Enterococcus sp. 7D2_DIV0200]